MIAESKRELAISHLAMLGLLAVSGTACSPEPTLDPGSAGVSKQADVSNEAGRRAPLPADMSDFDAEIVERFTAAAADVDRHAHDSSRWYELGALYHAHDQFTLAAACYRQSLALAQAASPSPGRATLARTTYYLALAEQRAGNQAEALAQMSRVVDLEPGYAPARWRLGLWLLEDGDLEAALETLQEAVSRSPGDGAAHHALARAQLAAGSAAEAATTLEAWLGEQPSDRYARFLLATAYRRLGRAAAAQEELELGQGAQPAWSDPWSEEIEARRTGFPARLASATSSLDSDPRRAAEELERLRRQEPDNVTVLINLGIGYRRLERFDDSLAVLAEAVRLEPARGLGHFHLALTYADASRRAASDGAAADLMKAALDAATRAVELQPTSAKSHAMRGELLARAGQTEAAVTSYTLALEDPQDPAWLHRLGGLLCELERWTEAVGVLEGYIARVGADPDALFLLGVAQANSGNRDGARRSLEQALRGKPGDARIRSALDQLGGVAP